MTVEAFLSRKPVRHHHRRRRAARVRDATARTGLVAAPDPEAVAEAIDRLCESAGERDSARWARRAIARVEDITWDHVIDRLTESV